MFCTYLLVRMFTMLFHEILLVGRYFFTQLPE
jgi:hypothetical protein